jgi:HSP20 family protein
VTCITAVAGHRPLAAVTFALSEEPGLGQVRETFFLVHPLVVPDLPFRHMPFPRLWEAEDLIRVEEYRQDGALVVRAELPGIDSDKDVELTVSDGMLHIRAERREEERQEEKGYLRQELRYGSLARSLPLPDGVTESDITATCKSGILEVRIREPKREPTRKIPIAKS